VRIFPILRATPALDALKIASHARARACDVVHVQYPTWPFRRSLTISFLPALLRPLYRGPVVVTFHEVARCHPINRLRMRVRDALGRLNTLMARQGHMLETVAVNELKLRRERLESYQSQARYAFADSYDRAAKAQAASVQPPADEAVDQAAEPDGEERG
jgi:hypothetical protein